MQQPTGNCGTCGATSTPGGTSLKSCSKCQVQKYCSHTCQKKDWTAHKVVCVKGSTNPGNDPTNVVINDENRETPVAGFERNDETNTWVQKNTKTPFAELFEILGKKGVVHVVSGIVISRVSAKPPMSGYGYRLSSIPIILPGMLANPAWMDLPLVKALCGFEMRMIRIEDLGKKQLLDGQAYINAHAEALAIDVDPESAFFCESFARPTGPVVLTRLDYVEVDGELVAAMVRYVRRGLKEVLVITKEREAKGEEVDRKEWAEKLINKKAFTSFVDGMGKDDMGEEGSWLASENGESLLNGA